MTLEGFLDFTAKRLEDDCVDCPFAEDYECPSGEHDVECMFTLCPSNWSAEYLEGEIKKYKEKQNERLD